MWIVEERYAFLRLATKASAANIEARVLAMQRFYNIADVDVAQRALEYVATGAKVVTVLRHLKIPFAAGTGHEPGLVALQRRGTRACCLLGELTTEAFEPLTHCRRMPVGCAANKRYFQVLCRHVMAMTCELWWHLTSSWAEPFFARTGPACCVWCKSRPHLASRPIGWRIVESQSVALPLDERALSTLRETERKRDHRLHQVLRTMSPGPTRVNAYERRFQWRLDYDGPRTCYTGRRHDQPTPMEMRLEANDIVLLTCSAPDCQHRSHVFDYLWPLEDTWAWTPFTVIDMQYTDAGFIKPLQFGPYRVLVLQAAMNSGKSHAAEALIAGMRAEHERTSHVEIPFSCLMPSTRIQHAVTAKARFAPLGFAMYLDPPRPLQHLASLSGAVGHVAMPLPAPVPPEKHPMLIVQYESLFKVTSLRKDLFAVDEIRSTCSNMACPTTNGKNIATNFEAFNTLMQASNKVLFMDADIEYDGCVRDLLWHHYGTRPEQVCVLRYPPHPEHIRRIVVQRSFDKWIKRLLCVLREGKRVGVVLRTKKHGMEIERIVKRERNHLPHGHAAADGTPSAFPFLFYHSEADQNMVRDFEDVNAKWSCFPLVMLTSKVTVGADCHAPFDQVFVHAQSQGGCSARTIVQMTLRFRNVANKDIYTCLNIDKIGSDFGHDTIRNDIERHSSVIRHDLTLALSTSGATDAVGPLCAASSDAYKILAAHQAREDESDFKRMLLFQCKRLAWPVLIDTSDHPDNGGDLNDASADEVEVKAAWYAALTIHRGIVNDGNSFETERRTQTATARQLFINSVAFHHYQFRDRALTFDEFLVVERSYALIQHLHMLIIRFRIQGAASQTQFCVDNYLSILA